MAIVLPALAALVISFLLTPSIREFSRRLELGDKSDGHRKVHHGVIPSLGGIAIYFAFTLAVFIAAIADPTFYQFIHDKFWTVLLGGTLVLITGLVDDLYELNFKQKFAMQLAAASVVIFLGGYRIDSITNPLTGSSVDLPPALAIAITYLWIVGICNAINLIDGLDGLAAGVTAVAALVMLSISFVAGDGFSMILYGTLAGSLIGFLRYNFNPASIFMGDTGALFIGFMMACFSVQCHYGSSTAVMLIVPIIALGVPIFDTLLAPVRRLISGKHPFKPDRHHIHHRIMSRYNLSHRRTVLVIYGISIFFGLVAFSMTATRSPLSAVIISAFVAVLFIGFGLLGYFDSGTRLRLASRHAAKRALRPNASLAAEENRKAERSLK